MLGEQRRTLGALFVTLSLNWLPDLWGAEHRADLDGRHIWSKCRTVISVQMAVEFLSWDGPQMRVGGIKMGPTDVTTESWVVLRSCRRWEESMVAQHHDSQTTADFNEGHHGKLCQKDFGITRNILLELWLRRGHQRLRWELCQLTVTGSN